MKLFKKLIAIMLFLSLILILININSSTETSQNNIKSITIDRFVLKENQEKIQIANIRVDPKIELKNNKLISKTFDEVMYFLSNETTTSIGYILIGDIYNSLYFLVDKDSNNIYFEDIKDFSTDDVDYFTSKLMKYIKWDISK